jgi:hypothetical protein
VSTSEEFGSGSPGEPPGTPHVDAHDLLVRLGLAQYSAMETEPAKIEGLVEAQRIVRELAGIDAIHR